MSNCKCRVGTIFIAGIAVVALSGCITSRVEDARECMTGIESDESVVILAKSYHLGNETEDKYINCIEDAL